MITTSVISDLDYEVGSGSKTISFNPWTETLGNCGEFEYSFTTVPLLTYSPLNLNSVNRELTLNIENGFDS